MKKVIYLSIMFLMISLTISAQASGGEIRRPSPNRASNQKRVAEKPTAKPTALKPIQTETIQVDNIKIQMVRVEGGKFTMGLSKDRAEKTGNQEAFPAHKVTLSSYKISKTEVTNELWIAVMGPSRRYADKDKKPVIVEWELVSGFIQKLNEITGRKFRLPTEAEWEFAAKGGVRSQGYKYPGSNRADEVAWIYRNSEGKEHEVGKKKPNELGLYDMCGNVYEWCQDWYGPYTSEEQINPQGPISGKYHVNKGGNCVSGGDVILPEARFRDLGNSSAGIRLVLSD